MQKNELLHIYILNWNQAELTCDCVESLLHQTAPIEMKIFIIDNGSTDGSVEIFQHKYPDVGILANAENLGFQGGMNTGIKHALENSADYVLLLNNDTIADPKMIENLFNNLPDDCGMASPMMYYFDAPEKPWSIGGNINPIFLEVMRVYRRNIYTPEDVLPREFLPSCAWLVKRELFERVGMLDNRFFPIYYDDLDYCLRVKKNGFKVYLIPQAKLWHKVSLSVGGEHSPKERYYMARNSGYYFRKHMKIWQVPFIISFRLCSSIIWTVRLKNKENHDALLQFWKGIVDGWMKKVSR